MRRFLSRFRRDRKGSVVVEFAMVGPILIGMFLGVLQLGIGMQNYNALRGISADVARYAVVNYQTSTRLTTSQLEDYAKGRASNAPYGLVRSRYAVTVANATTQRVAGATEYTISMTYRIPTMLAIFGIQDVPISFSRPIFVIAT
ncbi:MAG: TadE/TadG family type IV pilus assembly protein [Novosphingobium sp.]